MKEFSILDLNAPVFKALLSYSLFQEFKKDKELFIEIRKDNYINVYYQGGCVAKIEYKNDIWTTTNAKYLGDKTSEYIPSEEYLTSNLSDVKKNIEKEYSQYKYLKTLNKEDLSEKYYQADLVLRKYAKTHLDAEFAYNKDDKQRIDIVCCDETGEISFLELKIIGDNRLNGEKPEVLSQMDKYLTFINRYENELLSHYQRVYDVKVLLGLPVPPCRPKSINKTPTLLILNNYIKREPRYEKRRIEKISTIKKACSGGAFHLVWLNSNGDDIDV